MNTVKKEAENHNSVVRVATAAGSHPKKSKSLTSATFFNTKITKFQQQIKLNFKF